MKTENQNEQLPTPDDRIKIRYMMSQRLKQLNKHESWTAEDIEDIFYCHQEWVAAHQDWYIPYDVINRLLFDRRTPEHCVERLQQFVDVMGESIQKKTEER